MYHYVEFLRKCNQVNKVNKIVTKKPETIKSTINLNVTNNNPSYDLDDDLIFYLEMDTIPNDKKSAY
tara:strand:+ start:383 stop:583 length:201 start_codon:yes stop_codon:yes gene_type:complete